MDFCNKDPPNSTENKVDKPSHIVLLESWLNKNMRIKLSDNRIIVGVFLCTDCHQNIIIGSCSEFLSEDDEDYRTLGLAMVPGRHIVSISVDVGFN